MSEELKPCPFCGSEAVFDNLPESYGYTPKFIRIKCTGCGVIVGKEPASDWSASKGTYSVEKQAIQQVVSKWNTRAQQGVTDDDKK